MFFVVADHCCLNFQHFYPNVAHSVVFGDCVFLGSLVSCALRATIEKISQISWEQTANEGRMWNCCCWLQAS